jgi:nucleotide-binding universal stress UspA family protein
MGTIVVGVDGSEGALSALHYALDEARMRGSDVKAVKAWHVPLAAYETGFAPLPLDLTDYEKLSTEALAKIIEGLGDAAEGVEITPVVHEGQAADVLLAEAKGADLLVVGSRGRGGFRGLLLGSISAQCAHHTPCPVMIIPPHPN